MSFGASDSNKSLQVVEIIASCGLKAVFSMFQAVSAPDLSALTSFFFHHQLESLSSSTPPYIVKCHLIFVLCFAASCQNPWTKTCHPVCWAAASRGIFQTAGFITNLIGRAVALFPKNILQLNLVPWRVLHILPELWAIMSLYKPTGTKVFSLFRVCQHSCPQKSHSNPSNLHSLSPILHLHLQTYQENVRWTGFNYCPSLISLWKEY